MNERAEQAWERHTADGFRCADLGCMFPVRSHLSTWCTYYGDDDAH